MCKGLRALAENAAFQSPSLRVAKRLWCRKFSSDSFARGEADGDEDGELVLLPIDGDASIWSSAWRAFGLVGISGGRLLATCGTWGADMLGGGAEATNKAGARGSLAC